MKHTKYLFGAICVSYFPAILFIAALLPTDWFGYWWNLLAVLLISAPYYLAFIQIGLFLSRWLGKRDVKKYKKVLSLIGMVVAFCAIIFSTIGWASDANLGVLLLSSILLIGIWVAEAIIKTVKKEKLLLPDGFKWKTFLLCTLIVLVIACFGILAVFQINEYRENKKAEEYTSRFEVWHNTPSIVCKRGERGEIVVHLKSNIDYTYTGASSDFRPNVALFYEDSSTGYYIPLDELPSTDDVATFTVYEGEVRNTTFCFTVPEDAPLGRYHIEMWFMYSREVQEGVLTVVE